MSPDYYGRRREEDTKKFKFDFTINLGHLISVGLLIVTMLRAYYGITGRMDQMQFKVDAMWNLFKIELTK